MSSGRLWLIGGLAVLGCAISLYLAAFQLGLIGDVWDPFFGSGSRAVLTSEVSRALPFPDALVGVAAYATEAALAAILAAAGGDAVRVVILLAAVGVAGALGGVTLAVLQPVAAKAFCTLCLGSSAISVLLGTAAVAECRDVLQARRGTDAEWTEADR